MKSRCMRNKTRKQNTVRYICQLLLLGSLSIGAINVSAQTEKKPDDQSGAQDKPLARIETIEAKIPLRAFDAMGKRALDLTPKDIVVIENGAGRQVTGLNLEPANILLVLDQSLETSTLKNDR